MATPEIALPAGSMSRTSSLPGARAWVALGCLCFVYVLNFLDRQLLAILAKPIEDSLHLSDGQMGLLGGLYFAAFYCFISIPVGWLADQSNRVRVLTVACAIWSAATMACGVAGTYAQLAAARMTVGFGEAGGVPPSYAVISDYFPPHRRGMALGIYNLGPPIGAALGVAFGASIAATLGWRYAFLILGAVGVVTAIGVALVVREPRRGALDERVAASSSTAGFAATLKMFFTRRSLMLAALGSGATQIITYGMGNFATLFLMREKGMTLHDVAIWFAIALIVGMGGGIYASGRLVDRYKQRSKAAYGWLPAASLTLAVPLYLLFVWTPTWPVALALLVGPLFLNYFYLTSSVALVQQEVRPDQRVVSGALLLLVMNFIGMGLGPTWVGAASDHFRATDPQHCLQTALYTLVPFYILAIALFVWLARVLAREERDAMQGAV